MVEIREETSDGPTNDQASSANNRDSSSSRNALNNARPPDFMTYVKANSSDVLCFVLRLATIFFALGYILPLSSSASQSQSYVKAFVAAAATNAFRLHQRLKSSNNAVFSREFLMDIMFEDSAHYLFYCLIFTFSTSVTMALVPITLYAVLHSVSFAVKTANEFGCGGHTLVLKAASLKSPQNTANILSMIACAEIAIMPIFVAMIFVGKANLFFPFIYYRFISMRYLSRRNPYTRDTFAGLKLTLYRASAHPRCPPFIRTVIHKAVNVAERLCPQMYNQNP